MGKGKINKLAVIVAVIPHILLGYPWFSVFRDTWFHGGGLTVEQLQNGPGYGVAFSIAIAGALVTSYVLAYVIVRTGEVSLAHGVKTALVLWLAFVCAVMGPQYTFEARSLGYFAVTAGYALVGFLIMGAVIGLWPAYSKRMEGES